MGKKESRKDVFKNVLKLLRLEAKKFGLMVELVESIAWQHLKEDKAPEKPTIHDRENLFDHVPWTFIPNTADFSGKVLRRKNTHKFRELKRHMSAIAKILEDAEMVK